MYENEISEVRSWIGRPYSELRCWDVVTAAFALRGVKLPGDYFAALPLFKTVLVPEAWDVIPVANHELGIVNHVGLYVGNDEYVHSVEGAGVVIHPLTREPFYSRIARTRGGHKGFLRLR